MNLEEEMQNLPFQASNEIINPCFLKVISTQQTYRDARGEQTDSRWVVLGSGSLHPPGIKEVSGDFSGGPAVKNQPSSAGDAY